MSGDIRPLFGLEFEVSFSALDKDRKRVSSPRVLQKFMSLAGARLDHLPARDSSGIFLSNGGRLYIDCGKPEITTPEVTTPTDACRYALAGEEILLDIGRELLSEVSQVKQVIMTRGNVSYSGSCNAWACHESYGHRCKAGMAEDFIPHAVSRIIYTGAGGFDSRSHGTRFLISPRVAHLHSAVSENTQRDRGIFNTKNEPLNRGGYSRLHVICGESESSILAQWLKMATTAVVVAMIQSGMTPGEGVQLRDPVRAMRDFANDVTLTATALKTDGRHITALDIQRQLLKKAQKLAVTGPLNDWLPLCLERWKEILDRLENGADGVERSIDWAIKLGIFRNHVQRRGLSWDQLEQWNGVLERLDALPVTGEEDYGLTGHVQSNSKRAEKLLRLRNDLDPHSSLNWDQLELVLQVRQELFEIDTRFGEFGERGFFNALDAQGLLDHHVAGVEDIQQATLQPPVVGRARLRGRAIRNLAQQNKTGACEWSAVWDYDGLRMLDLSDPFASQESWTHLTESMEPTGRRNLSAARAFDQALSLYDRGDYESAFRMMRIVLDRMGTERGRPPQDCCRFFAWIQSHRGYTDGASWLDISYPSGPQTLGQVCDYLLVHRFQGLQPGPGLRHWCDRGFDLLSETAEVNPCDVVALRCSHAFDLLCQGQPVAAWNAYHDGIEPDWLQTIHRRYFARILTEKAGVLRQLGRLDEAMTHLSEAEQVQTDGHFNGDLADLTLTRQAKVTAQRGSPSDAMDLLQRAVRMQRDAANVVGEARTLLLMARLCARVENGPEGFTLDTIQQRLTQVRASRPALAACPLTSKILEHWNCWVAGDTDEPERPGGAEHADEFWRL